LRNKKGLFYQLEKTDEMQTEFIC